MQLEDFMKLTPEEQVAFLTERDALTRQVDDLTAERNSLQTENSALTEQVTTLTGEVTKVKEMNYTLTRRLNLDDGNNKAPEDLLHDMFYEERSKK